eukprot:1933287-Pleurochrysis_carterae.AAC.1
MAAIVALVAVDAMSASVARMCKSSLPLPLPAVAYERLAAWYEMKPKIEVINLRSVASMSSGATM